MVQLTLTPAAKAAIDRYGQITIESNSKCAAVREIRNRLFNIEVGDPINHSDLVFVSTSLSEYASKDGKNGPLARWRLETLLRGAKPYQRPLPPKPEPTSEYKALMKRLRDDEERKQYERMLHPPTLSPLASKSYPGAETSFNPALSIGQAALTDEVDDVTYADVNRQLALIINILVSIVACSVAIWIAARRWDAPQRLGFSLSGSAIVAFAEVAIYMGYIRRIQEAKSLEAKSVEKKEVVETWVLNREPGKKSGESVRYRKGKHR